MEEVIQFGQPNVNAIHRKTVVAVLYDPNKKEFFYCDWPEYGLCCLVSWWLEEKETYLEAAIREIKEETWYILYENLWKLGGNIVTNYYMSQKKEYRAKHIQAYLFIIDPTEKIDQSLEIDEKFSIKAAKYESLLEFMRWYKNEDGTWLEDHIEILERAKNELERLCLL